MDSTSSSEDDSTSMSSSSTHSYDSSASVIEVGGTGFEPPPIFTELLELTTYDDGNQVNY